MKTKNDYDIGRALRVGLELLEDRDVRVPACNMNDLVALKSILLKLLQGELVVVTPDVVEAASAAPKDETPK